jgi:chaperonin GroEL
MSTDTAKLVSFDLEARNKLLQGVNILAEAVKTTMGPRGRNVVIEVKGSHPVVTKDGVTVAQAINLREPVMNLGVQMAKEAASRTAEVAGDGTTTATVLTQAIFSEGMKMLAAGYQASDLKKGIDAAVTEVISSLKESSIGVTRHEEIEQIATISANGEKEIGELIASAIRRVGNDGVVAVEEAKGFATTLTVVEGMRIERGYLSPYFITDNDRMVVELDKPYILLCDRRFDNLKELTPLLEKILNAQRPLLIVAEDVEGEAMQALVLNKMKGSLKVCAIRSPGFGESRTDLVGDLGTILGCDPVVATQPADVMGLQLSSLGTCTRVIVSRHETTFIGGAGSQEKIDQRIAACKESLRSSQEIEEAQHHKARLARLAGGVAVIRVGGATESELRERKDRVDDALHATQAAIAEGIVPGGGVALVRSAGSVVADSLDGYSAGKTIVKNACSFPLKQIVYNAGGTPDVILNSVAAQDKNYGYDAYRGVFGNMFEMGIIDPVKVVRSALENAASAAGMMLTIGCAMVDDESLNS